MKIEIFFFVIFSTELTKGAVNFTVHRDWVNWYTAKSRCEDLGGRLAVLDNPQKRTTVQELLYVGYNHWIGFHDVNDNNAFVWLHGKPLADDDENWRSGEPDHGNDNCGLIHLSSLEFVDAYCYYSAYYICETFLCDAGYYKNGSHCVMCSGSTVKPTVDDDISCPTVCDGITKVPNLRHTACVCSVGHYKDGDECVMCSGNTVKSTVGDDTSCPTVCDGITKVVNSGHSACVCNAGFSKDGDDCVMCTGNTVKSTEGDDTSCRTVCDGFAEFPNAGHTACGFNSDDDDDQGADYLFWM